MPLDPSIFPYYAGLEQQRNAQLQESLGKSIESVVKAKQSGLDLKKMAERGAYEYNATGKMRDEDALALKTLADLEGSKTQYAQDPMNPGTLRAVTTPNAYQLLVERTQGAQYQPQYRPLGQAPSAPRVMVQETTMQPSIAPVDQMQLSEGIPPISEDQMNAVIPSLPNLPIPRYPAQDAMTPQQAQAAERSRSMMQAPAQEFPTPRGGLVNPIPETGISAIEQMKSAMKVQEEAAKDVNKKEIEKQYAKPKEEQKVKSSASNIRDINVAIDRAISQSGGYSAGFWSGIQGTEKEGYIPGSPAENLRATLSTIKSDAALTRLQKIRDESPTGGALGAITERELDLLQNASAALSQSQSPSQLKDNLIRYKQIRNNAMLHVRDAFVDQYGDDGTNRFGDLPPYGSKVIGTTGGKMIYQLPDGSYVKEK